MVSKKALLYFVKYPEAGKVKTRLAASIGDEEAAKVYRNLVEMNLSQILSLPNRLIDLIIVFDPPEKEAEVKVWLKEFNEAAVIPAKAGIQKMDSRLKRSGMTFWPQKGKDLGVRLANAFDDAFSQGYERVIALGSDTLGLKSELLIQAFDVLDFYDVVIGPAKDGGYYLIGLSTERASLFQGIEWSTAQVLNQTLSKLKDQNLSFYLLRELEDLDELKLITGGKRHEIFT